MSKRSIAYSLAAFVCAVLIAACGRAATPTPDAAVETPPAPTETAVDPAAALVALAEADLAQRLGIDAEAIAVQCVEATEFPDASLGVPEPGQVYAQVITPGYVIELSADGQTYVYHGSGERVIYAPAGDEGQPATGRITIEAVQVTADQVVVRGTSTLPDGTCVSTELWADGELQAWWPSDACSPVEGGKWEQAVSVADGRALAPDVQYVVRAFQPGGPDIVAAFPFDLEPPPAPPTQAPADDATLLLPDSAEVVGEASGDLDGDGAAELVLLAGFGGSPDEFGYDSLDLFVLTSSASVDAIAGYEVAWRSGALIGERPGSLTIEDVNGDGQLEVLCLQSMGASGVALQIAAWSGEGYRLLQPLGGRFDGQNYFGDKGVRLEDIDGDGIVEIHAAYGPAASLGDVYGWDGEAYVYRETLGKAEPETSPQRALLSEAGISLEIPAGWIEATPCAWAAPGGGQLGVQWLDLQPPQEPEAALLPQPAQILESEPVELAWGSGRRFTLEVYGEAVEGEGQAPVVSVETHVLVVVDWDGGRRAFDVFVAASSAEQAAQLESVLEQVLASVVFE